jgi:uncharacterized membrane protein YfcA
MTPPESLTLSNATLPLLIALVFVLAGVVKGVVGLGLPTISMALLALMMTPADAAALLIFPSLITNVWQIRPWGTLGPMFKRLAPMQLTACFGTLTGAWVFGAPAGVWATVCLGTTLIGYAAWGLAGMRMSVRPSTEKWLGPVIGATTGLVTAVTGVFMIPAVPYLQALELKRDELIQAMGITFTVSTLALAVGLYFNTRYSAASFGASVLMLLPALAGMAAGQYCRQKLSPALFRRCFLGSLILLGIHMITNEFAAL